MRYLVFYLLLVGLVGIMASVVFLPELFKEGGTYDHFQNLLSDKPPINNPEVVSDKENAGITGFAPQGSSDSGSDSGSGSGGGSGENAGQQESYCYFRQFAYSIQNFAIEQSCENTFLDFCSTKRVYCSLEVLNLDKENEGLFGIRMYVLREGYEIEEAIQSQYIENLIPHGEQRIFNFEFEVYGESSEDDANQELTCLYVTENIPKREFCI